MNILYEPNKKYLFDVYPQTPLLQTYQSSTTGTLGRTAFPNIAGFLNLIFHLGPSKYLYI